MTYLCLEKISTAADAVAQDMLDSGPAETLESARHIRHLAAKNETG
jgi:hypothetical protein